MLLVRFVPRAALALSSLVVSAGCSVALDLDEVQCETDADCDARGGELEGTICVESVCRKPEPEDPKWGCIGKVEPLASGEMNTLSSRLLDLITNQPATNITVKLCNKYDAPCEAPINTPVPDADGVVTVTIPSELEAYLDVQGPDYYPTIAFLDHVAQDKNEVVYIIPTGIVEALAVTADVTLDESKGILLGRMTDCTLAPTAGASVSVFPTDKETRFYTINNTATPDASQTDSAGNSGFINVSPGTVTMTGTVGPMGKTFGTVSTLIRSGTITAQILRPTPEQ